MKNDQKRLKFESSVSGVATCRPSSFRFTWGETSRVERRISAKCPLIEICFSQAHDSLGKISSSFFSSGLQSTSQYEAEILVAYEVDMWHSKFPKHLRFSWASLGDARLQGSSRIGIASCWTWATLFLFSTFLGLQTGISGEAAGASYLEDHTS